MTHRGFPQEEIMTEELIIEIKDWIDAHCWESDAGCSSFDKDEFYDFLDGKPSIEDRPKQSKFKRRK